MRRVILLAILALAVPMVALADAVPGCDPNMDLNFFVPPNMCNFDLEQNLINEGVGSISGTHVSVFANGPIDPLDPRSPELFFSLSGVIGGGGTVQVSGDDLDGHSFLFTDSVTDLTAGDNGNCPPQGVEECAIGARATLLPEPGIKGGSAEVGVIFENGGIGTNSTGSVDIILAPVPEPGTLGMLGTGLIGLARVARRKLKLKLWT